ncbi:MAG: TetR/AcrR family transcriptional regulator [Proteobacteria bacterium]|nr:TetR/AcrR family transcriptional regulator [Pseudomonadota bacterium]
MIQGPEKTDEIVRRPPPAPPAAGRRVKTEPARKPLPPAGIKLAQALRLLLAAKDFNSITTAEIAREAGANEALIYRYFGDKRGLLHYVLREYLEAYISQTEHAVKGIQGALNKVRKLIWSHMNFYSSDRVFSKILLLEVRNDPGYWQSEPYRLIQGYGDIILEMLEEGMANGEIRPDVSPSYWRQLILGAIEHLCLPAIIFNHEIDVDFMAGQMCDMVFFGLKAERV